VIEIPIAEIFIPSVRIAVCVAPTEFLVPFEFVLLPEFGVLTELKGLPVLMVPL